MGKLKIWATEQDEILGAISSSVKSKRWKKASEELLKHGYERTDVECRQRYINHLDPGVNKELWSDEELEILYTKYSEYGNKWFLLQKHLPGRTQTKIKNYFYGNIRYLLKNIIKHFYKKSTGFVNDIKTDTLLDLYEAKNNFSGYYIIPDTIKRLQYRVDKNNCDRIIRQKQEDFSGIAELFVQNYIQKNEPTRKEENDFPSQEDSQSQQIIKVECPRAPTPVSLVSSVGGEITKIQSEMQYLLQTSTRHYQLYEHFKNAYLSLEDKQNCTENS